MKWKYDGYRFYNFWRNLFSNYFNFDLGLGGGWEKTTKKSLNIYFNCCGFHITLFFRRKE